MCLYHRFVLRSQRSKESAFTHVIQRETSFHIGISREYGGYNICVHGSSQLRPLCAILCNSGPCALVLFSFILPRRISWTEVPFFNTYVFNTEMLWQMTLLYFLNLPVSLERGTICTITFCENAGCLPTTVNFTSFLVLMLGDAELDGSVSVVHVKICFISSNLYQNVF